MMPAYSHRFDISNHTWSETYACVPRLWRGTWPAQHASAAIQERTTFTSCSYWLARPLRAGTTMRYKPGMVTGGSGYTHDCGNSRAIGWFLEPLAVIALYGKKVSPDVRPGRCSTQGSTVKVPGHKAVQPRLALMDTLRHRPCSFFPLAPLPQHLALFLRLRCSWRAMCTACCSNDTREMAPSF